MVIGYWLGAMVTSDCLFRNNDDQCLVLGNNGDQ